MAKVFSEVSMDTSKTMVGIVILNYKTYSDTMNLVEGLQRQTIAKQLSIVVVDNASPNDSYNMLKALEEQYINVTVLQTNANLGYAKGNNWGLQYMERYIMPYYVAILNNDILLQENCLEQLVERYNKLDKPAFISPVMLDGKGKTMHPPKKKNFIDDCLNMFILYRILSPYNSVKIETNTGKEAVKVDIIPGSFMFSSFEVFQKIGYFYTDTFLFAEERFITKKTEEVELFNYILPDQYYVHYGSKTIKSALPPIKQYRYLYDGWLRYTRKYRKNGKLKAMILYPLMKFSLLEIRIVYWLFKRNNEAI